jgi:hypothetical protein
MRDALEGLAMGQKVDLQKRKVLFSRRVEFDLTEKMSEIRELREAVRLAETAAMRNQIATRPERPVDTQTK